eukprot:891561-Amorphochlora_amoeboformis.AAC.3
MSTVCMSSAGRGHMYVDIVHITYTCVVTMTRAHDSPGRARGWMSGEAWTTTASGYIHIYS